MMKHVSARTLKLALVVSAAALFAVACSSSSDTKQSNAAAPATNNAAPAASPTVAANATPADPIEQAKATFSNTCAKCHKPDGAGGEVTIEGEKLKVPNLREGRSVTKSDDQLHNKIVKGGDGMPGFGKRLTADQINALVKYIRQDFQGKK